MAYDRYRNPNFIFNEKFEHKAPELEKVIPSFMTNNVLESKALPKRRAKNKLARKARRLNKKRRRK